MKPTITITDFAKLDIRIGKVVEASIPEGSNKLIRQVVDFGEEIGRKIIFSGIQNFYAVEDLIGKQLPYIINLPPRAMMGEESQGMLLAVAPETESGEHGCVLLEPIAPLVNGSPII
jgi:methionyl-tRNA synthetase